jgi:hypothetical protein
VRHPVLESASERNVIISPVRIRVLALTLILMAIAAGGACKCSSEPGGGSTDASLGDGSTSGPGSMCVAEGQACTVQSTPCCTANCLNGVCTMTVACDLPGEHCTVNTDCCTGNCTNGTCGEKRCAGIGQTCAAANDCCSTICGANHQCQEVPPVANTGTSSTCKTLGEACASGSACCSTDCQGGVCVQQAPCHANGDICHQNSDCCGNVCSAAAGGVGRCEFITGAGAGGCIQDGNPCPSGGSNCCSRICTDIGFGVPVCQLAGGCRLTGDYCTNVNQCCGGGMNPNGTVQCRDAPNGRCDEGQACQPVGNICGAHVLPGGGSINAPQDCCDGMREVCKLDSSGIPRCFGGGSAMCPKGYDPTNPNCCLHIGQACQFRDQCCDRDPCVPTASGGFVCAAAPTCQVAGASCMVGAAPGANGCCTGLSCIMGSGGTTVCATPPSPSSDGGVTPSGDGGVRDAGAPAPCAANGAQCTSAAGCCSGICTGSTCAAPMACQPGGAACSSNGDCCSGLYCSIASGMTSGTCQTGATCNASGQPCSGTQPCCSGLLCVGVGTTTPCNGSTACVCFINL